MVQKKKASRRQHSRISLCSSGKETLLKKSILLSVDYKDRKTEDIDIENVHVSKRCLSEEMSHTYNITNKCLYPRYTERLLINKEDTQMFRKLESRQTHISPKKIFNNCLKLILHKLSRMFIIKA